MEELSVHSVNEGYQHASRALREKIQAWDVDSGDPVRSSAVLIIARTGTCVFGMQDRNWHLALRYVNHARSVFTGDIILVTEHGWTDSVSGLGDHLPRIHC